MCDPTLFILSLPWLSPFLLVAVSDSWYCDLALFLDYVLDCVFDLFGTDIDHFDSAVPVNKHLANEPLLSLSELSITTMLSNHVNHSVIQLCINE